MVYFRLIIAAACPVLATAVLYLLSRKTALGRWSRTRSQLLYGLLLGGVSVFCSEFGVPAYGVIINVRDAAPLSAGLVFGAPAGILAGLIGGMERWFAVYWGAGTYTRLACSVSTILAGLLGAAIRKWMFDDKKPSWYYGFAVGLVMEVLHMLMIFFTNMSDVKQAFTFVKGCAPPMIVANAFSVMFCLLTVTLMGKERLRVDKEHKQLSQTFSRWLFAVVMAAFVITSLFTFILQNRVSISDNTALLWLNIEDVKADVGDASDENLLRLTRSVAQDIEKAGGVDNSLLYTISAKPGNDFSEINVVGEDGIIACSTNRDYVGFDMASGDQARDFLVLLEGEKTEYVQSYQPTSRNADTYMKYAGVALADGGFVQVGYDAARFRQDIDQEVVGATRNRHVGETGFIIICGDDSAKTVVSSPHGGEEEGESLSVTGLSLEGLEEGRRYEAEVYGVPSYLMYTVSEGYYIIAVEPVDEVLFFRDLSVYVTVFMEIIVFAVLFALVYLLIKKLVVENIHRINGTLAQITGGNLNVSVDVRTNEEFVSLSDDINSTVTTLKGYIAEAAARIDKELEIAKVIQSSTLPSVFPPYPDRTDFDIYATMDTAKEVGGDFYDFYLLDENRLAFLIADVSGKGITAAMFMMQAKSILKSCAEREGDVARILAAANDALCEGNDAEMFVTCWMGILNLATGELTFASAGHNPPVIRQGGETRFLEFRPGFVLGEIEHLNYRTGQLTLEPGDEIYLYTDGVTEATDAQLQLYGNDRLLAAMKSAEGLSAQEVCRLVKADVDRFAGDAPQFDDITMLHLRLLPRDKITVKPEMDSVERVLGFVEDTLRKAGTPEKILVKMNIVTDEIFSNIVRYSGAAQASVEVAVADGEARLIFTDDGRPYDPTQKPDPDTTAPAEEREIGGMGIFIVKKFMDRVDYLCRDGRNILTLTKRFDPPTP